MTWAGPGGSKTVLRGKTELNQMMTDSYFFRVQTPPQVYDSRKGRNDVCFILTFSFNDSKAFIMLSARGECAEADTVLTLY